MAWYFQFFLLPLLVAAQAPTTVPQDGPPQAENYFATSNCSSQQVCVDGSWAAFLPGYTSQQCLEACSEAQHGFQGMQIGSCTHFSFGSGTCILYTRCGTLGSSEQLTFGSGIGAQVVTDTSLFTTCVVPWKAPVFADWVLISSQDRGVKAFSSDARNTFVQDQSNPDSGAYMIIGSLDKDSLKTEEGLYHFKLVFFDGAEADGDVLEWKQSSWLDADRPSGTLAISPDLMSGNGCTGFRGLAKSNNGAAVMDGDGSAGGCWWNCVGNIHKYGHGFPANNGQIKKKYTLYIWADPKKASAF